MFFDVIFLVIDNVVLHGLNMLVRFLVFL